MTINFEKNEEYLVYTTDHSVVWNHLCRASKINTHKKSFPGKRVSGACVADAAEIEQFKLIAWKPGYNVFAAAKLDFAHLFYLLENVVDDARPNSMTARKNSIRKIWRCCPLGILAREPSC